MDNEEAVGAGGVEVLQHDPLVFELNRLQNLIKEKERELGAAQSEIKALRATETKKKKAIEELQNNSNRMDEKLRLTQNHLAHKNLEIKKLADEKREALAAQYAAEGTLRRVHANQKDDDSVPIESIIAPLKAEIKIYRVEIASLQEDNKALERLTKSKELALLEAEKILRSALERALIVEEIQNYNFELKRQIEICQEENRILDKTYRQKVSEVEKLTETIKELEEAILAGGAAANTIRDCRRQISELKEDKRTLERELCRVRVSANRVATVVANEWKDDNDKVMPVKQWLVERRIFQAETQRLREKLSISERTAKAEAQLKDKLKLRLKTLEEGLKHVSTASQNSNAFCASPKPAKSGNVFGFLSSNAGLKRSISQPKGSSISKTSPLQQPNGHRDILEKKHGSKENINKRERENQKVNENTTGILDNGAVESEDIKTRDAENEVSPNKGSETDDMVSGFLYDKLQKELILLRKTCELKEHNLSSKNEEIKILTNKVDTLTRAIEVESRRLKKEAAAIKEEDRMLAKMDHKNNRNVRESILKAPSGDDSEGTRNQ